jgi:ribosomal protein S21
MANIPHPVSFKDDEGAFADQKKKKWRRYADDPTGKLWNQKRSIKSFTDAKFTLYEAEQLVFDQHIRATSPLGKSLRTHRQNLVKDYVAQGMTENEAVEFIGEYLAAIKEERGYDFDAIMAEVTTYQKRFVDEPIDRKVGESIDSALERWKEARKKTGTWKERHDKIRRLYKEWKKEQKRDNNL